MRPQGISRLPCRSARSEPPLATCTPPPMPLHRCAVVAAVAAVFIVSLLLETEVRGNVLGLLLGSWRPPHHLWEGVLLRLRAAAPAQDGTPSAWPLAARARHHFVGACRVAEGGRGASPLHQLQAPMYCLRVRRAPWYGVRMVTWMSALVVVWMARALPVRLILPRFGGEDWAGRLRMGFPGRLTTSRH